MRRVGLLGCGVVGGGVVELLRARGAELGLSLARVAVRDLERRQRDGVPDGVPIGTVDEVLADPSIDIVVEVIGGLDPALRAVKSALECGKDVVTANKVLVSEYGDELRAAARARGVGFRYEASVAGCLPIVEIIEKGLIFDEVDRLFGILNGTCNFILTQCQRDRVAYATALRSAQEAGFAEADPRLDVSGADTAQKLAILASLITKKQCTVRMVSMEGIEALTPVDHLAADEIGSRIKLLASFVRRGERAELRVAPTLVPAASALGLTTDEYNVVEVECRHIGWQLYLGKGAGRMPTAAAVVHDLAELAKGRPPSAPAASVKELIDAIAPDDQIATWCVRIPAENPAWPVSKVGALFSERGIEIVEFRRSTQPGVGSLVLTAEAGAGAVRAAAAGIARLPGAAAPAVVLAMEPDA